MKYCQRCILPDTRPGIRIGDDGICSGCVGHNAKQNVIDWDARLRDWEQVVERAKERSRGYDCLIPVSGGKDSTWQVVKCLEYGLNPLAVTWKTPGRTELGQRNLDNLVRLGVDHVDYQINPKVERKFMYQSLVRFGSTAVPMHMALFSIPLKLAVRYEIPLVIWGENAALEYGGTDEDRFGYRLNSEWIRKYGVVHGTTAQDWISPELTAKELTPYFVPTDEELSQAGVDAVFLGCYFSWDPEESLRVATEHGFQSREEGPRTGYWNYADLDDDFISLHHFLKWHKFGMTRTWDNLSVEIRNGRLTRDEAISVLRARGDETPHEDIEKFCAFAGITKAHFFDVIERYRNPQLWTRRAGAWEIEGFLISDWNWS